jgi:osmotically-inducible protein OsmY
VKLVHNHLQVLPPSSALARSADAAMTTRIKTAMLADNTVPGSKIKVVTENGMVYLLGLVTRAEANRATAVAQGVGGVQGIVRLFEYTD